MNQFMFISALVSSYLCNVLGQSSCRTPTGGSGSCISLYDCSELLAIATKSNKTPTDIDSLRRHACGFENKTPKVCCPAEVQLHQRFEPEGQNQGIDIGPIKICNGTPGVAPPDPASGCCGQQESLPDKIVGGEATGIDEYPWMALLENSDGFTTRLLCGGALISDRYVLTAGHCVAGDVIIPRDVRLGEYDTSNSIDEKDCITITGGGEDCTKGPVIIPIEKMIPHPDYDPYDKETRRHDIALVRMTKSAPYTYFIRPICLPTSDLTLSPPPDWKLIAAGWGAVNTTHLSTVKLYVDLPFVALPACQPAYRYVKLWHGQMCAGGENGKDSCKGDSGGPLMWEKGKNNTFFEFVGIVSFGPFPCGSENVPGIYTKVYEYNSWIRQTIKP